MLTTMDSLVVGGHPYDGLAEYWTNAEVSSYSSLERAVAKNIYDHHKFVLTRSDIALIWRISKAVLVTDDDSFICKMSELKSSAGRISVKSGVKTRQRCIQHRLFDGLWVLVHPVIASEGDKLFVLAQQLQVIEAGEQETGLFGCIIRESELAANRCGFAIPWFASIHSKRAPKWVSFCYVHEPKRGEEPEGFVRAQEAAAGTPVMWCSCGDEHGIDIYRCALLR